ncbi:MAG: vitamin K epoxide reductase family protein [Vicinamibacterales bacterium]
MSSRYRRLILAFALVGLGMATASSWVHYRVLTDPTYVSPCDINATFNCTQVYLSRFGSVAGVPVALFGLLWFAMVALVAGFAKPTDGESVAGGYLFALSTIGLAVVLYLGYASFVVLHTGCVLCMGTYVCVLAIFVLSSLTRPVSVMRLPLRLVRDIRDVVARPAALVAALILLAGTASLVAFFPKEGTVAAQAASAPPASAEARQSFEQLWAKQPRVDLGIAAEGAKVVIVKFNDYMCPTCRSAEMFYRPILQRFETSHPGQVKYVMKDWPWNSTCNFNARTTIPGHEAACAAAAAARMARDRGKSTEMVDWLYANQGTTPKAVSEAAAKILGVTDFDHEYALKLPEIRKDVADGGVLNIEGTPTFFINGVRLPGAGLSQENFELAIDLELKRPTP